MELVDDFNEFFAPTSHDLVDGLIAEYDAMAGRIIALHTAVNSESVHGALHYFIEGNRDPHGHHANCGSLFNLEGALGKLSADFWNKALMLTDVFDLMPQNRRNEWHEQLRNPLGKKRDKYATEYEIQPLPAFDQDTVRATLEGLLYSRSKFFAERVDGIFRALSRDHVTNRPEGFGKRMIIPRLIDQWGLINYSSCGHINDLRCVIAKFMGREEPAHGDTQPIIAEVRKHNGEWHSIDGGTLRIRVYNGVGTAHLEVHPEMAWRLNAVLASLYPQVIPAQNREKPKNARKLKDFDLFDNLLPASVVRVLAGASKGFEWVEDFRHGKNRKYLPNTIRFSCDNKAIEKQVEAVLQSIGGIYRDKNWHFDYDPAPVIGQIICEARIPDVRAYQYYPTPEVIARDAVDLAAVDAPEIGSWLEPSAGTGAIADLFPQDACKTVIEVSDLRCTVLKQKNYDAVICADFMAYDQSAIFDRIVMNPPYSEGRWQAHTEKAFQLLKRGGRLVAILPASAKNKLQFDGAVITYGKTYHNAFAGASVSVVIAVIDKQ